VELQFTPFEPKALLEETQALLAERARHKGLQLLVAVPKTDPQKYWGDRGRLRQVLVNLVDNAVKFTSRGHVKMQLQSLGKQGESTLLHFEVIDTGIGIAPDFQEIIFQSFTQVDGTATRRHSGSGLGLAICRQLVQLMGGRIGVDSAPGQGSRFWFTIPMRPAPTDDIQPPETPAERAPICFTGTRVLVVEDNPINQEVAKAMLGRLGCQVVLAADGQEGLSLLANETFDVVLMDCHMPRLDGFSATAEIRRREKSQGRKHVPIIALTANVMKGCREKCLAAGMDDYLAKPFRKEQLVEILARYLAIGRTEDSPAPAATEGASDNAGPPLDPEPLQALKSMERPDGPRLLSKIVGLYLRNTPDLLQEMEHASSWGDLDTVGHAARRLRSSSISVGALRLAAVCRELEQQLQAHQLDKAAQLVIRANQEYHLVQAALIALDTDPFQR
jgi:CheY-like chemotaxis protein/HPt (histidine-containing phosphotransfer) domain-containing protein